MLPMKTVDLSLRELETGIAYFESTVRKPIHLLHAKMKVMAFNDIFPLFLPFCHCYKTERQR